MDNRLTELIAIGASVTANCHPCLEYHLGKAREYGVDDQEIREAIDVGKMVRKGAAGKWDEYAAALLEGRPPSTEPGCGCG